MKQNHFFSCLLFGAFFFISSSINSQSLTIISIEVINDVGIDDGSGRFKSDEEPDKYVAQLVMEAEGDLSQLANVEVKLNQFSKDLKSEAVVFDRKISYSLQEDAERDSRILQKESIILIELGTFSEPAFFKARVVLEDKSGKKSQPVFYRPIKE
jgi:hypothetical protein